MCVGQGSVQLCSGFSNTCSPCRSLLLITNLASYSSINLNLESRLSSRLMLPLLNAVPTNQSHNRFSALWPTEDKVRYLQTNHSHSLTPAGSQGQRTTDHHNIDMRRELLQITAGNCEPEHFDRLKCIKSGSLMTTWS